MYVTYIMLYLYSTIIYIDSSKLWTFLAVLGFSGDPFKCRLVLYRRYLLPFGCVPPLPVAVWLCTAATCCRLIVYRRHLLLFDSVPPLPVVIWLCTAATCCHFIVYRRYILPFDCVPPLLPFDCVPPLPVAIWLCTAATCCRLIVYRRYLLPFDCVPPLPVAVSHVWILCILPPVAMTSYAALPSLDANFMWTCHAIQLLNESFRASIDKLGSSV